MKRVSRHVCINGARKAPAGRHYACRLLGGAGRVVRFASGFIFWAQSLVPPPPPPGVDVPDWALPQSATHTQVPPPADFHRPSVTINGTIGQFDAQTDVGGPLAPGSASYDPASKTYTINSAGYNIWYQRDEFHYLWKKMSGDVSMAASVNWPNMDDFHDRKVVLIFRDSLDDDQPPDHGGPAWQWHGPYLLARRKGRPDDRCRIPLRPPAARRHG